MSGKAIKNSCYDKLKRLGINFDDKIEISVIEEHLKGEKLYSEDLYAVLYFLVEREKFYSTYGIEPKIYPVLSEKSKNILTEMFLGRLESLSKEDAEIAKRNITQFGYFSVLDKGYEAFFNERVTGSVKYKQDSLKAYTVKNSVYPFVSVDSMDAFGKTKDTVSTFLGAVTPTTTVKRIGNLYAVDYSFKLPFRNPDKTAYFDSAMQRIKLPKGFKLLGSFYGKYIASIPNGKAILDSNFNILLKFRPGQVILVDYKRRRLFVTDNYLKKNTIYDEKLNKVRAIYENVDIHNNAVLNDGILTTHELICDPEVVTYYDLDKNMKVIDEFEYSRKIGLESNFGFNNGLYNYSNGRFDGFKDRNGNIVFKPAYLASYAFRSGCSFVVDREGYPGFLDKFGNFTCRSTIIPSHHYESIDVGYDPELDRVVITNFAGKNGTDDVSVDSIYPIYQVSLRGEENILGLIKANQSLNPYDNEKGKSYLRNDQ